MATDPAEGRPRKRAPKGSGYMEQLPSGKWRVTVSRTDPLTRKRRPVKRTFDTRDKAVVGLH